MHLEGGKLEIKECATLGTYFADVYCDGVLFAREMSRPVAECFVEHWLLYPNAFADEAKLRTWVIEHWDAHVQRKLSKMKYILQSNWDFPRREDGWKSTKACREFDDLDRAIKALRHDANLARVVCDLRVVDQDGKVYATYEVAEDMRLRGCRWNKIQRNAYFLWQEAGSPVCDGTEFWNKAEEQLDEEAIGVTVCCEKN